MDGSKMVRERTMSEYYVSSVERVLYLMAALKWVVLAMDEKN